MKAIALTDRTVYKYIDLTKVDKAHMLLSTIIFAQTMACDEVEQFVYFNRFKNVTQHGLLD